MTENQISSLFRRLSTLHPQIAIKKSSACSSRRHRLSNCLATFSIGSSSLVISFMSVSPNRSNNLSSSSTTFILLLFIFFATKICASLQTSKNICIFQDNLGIVNEIVFEEQAVTESNNKPDFLFPNGECYQNIVFPTDGLTMLGAKTTCKDRWRQVINEADRIWPKHLFTLQPGISKNQLKEMADSQVMLVVPQKNISTFPVEYQSSLSNLSGFIQMVRKKQESLPKYYILS